MTLVGALPSCWGMGVTTAGMASGMRSEVVRPVVAPRILALWIRKFRYHGCVRVRKGVVLSFGMNALGVICRDMDGGTAAQRRGLLAHMHARRPQSCKLYRTNVLRRILPHADGDRTV